MSRSATSPKLSPVILEAMARTLSDHDLLRFMLSSKEAFNATLDALSTVDHINYHDQNFEQEPCITFKMRRDDSRKPALNYITHSNPLLNFVVNFIRHNITKVEISELVEVSSWVLNAFISTRLVQLSLGVVLPKNVQKVLKHAPKLTEIRYTSFDIFIANGYTAMQATKVIIDYIDFSKLEEVFPKSEVFSFPCLKNVENLVIGEEELFLNNYDLNLGDFRRKYWNLFIRFLKFFPSLKSFEIHLSGSSNYPLEILEHFVFISRYVHNRLPSRTTGVVNLYVLVPPHEWIAICTALINALEDETRVLDFDNSIQEGIKNRRFQFGVMSWFQQSYTITRKSDSSCKLDGSISYYGRWDEYDFDAENNQEYDVPVNFDEYFGVPADSDDEIPRAVTTTSTDLRTNDQRENNVQTENAFTFDTDSDISTREDLNLVNCSIFDDDFEPESLDADVLNIHTFYDTETSLSSAASDFYENCTNDTCETKTYGSDDEASTLSIENSTYDDSESQARGIDNDMIDNLSESNETTCKSDYNLESTQNSLTDDKDGAD